MSAYDVVAVVTHSVALTAYAANLKKRKWIVPRLFQNIFIAQTLPKIFKMSKQLKMMMSSDNINKVVMDYTMINGKPKMPTTEQHCRMAYYWKNATEQFREVGMISAFMTSIDADNKSIKRCKYISEYSTVFEFAGETAESLNLIADFAYTGKGCAVRSLYSTNPHMFLPSIEIDGQNWFPIDLLESSEEDFPCENLNYEDYSEFYYAKTGEWRCGKALIFFRSELLRAAFFRTFLCVLKKKFGEDICREVTCVNNSKSCGSFCSNCFEHHISMDYLRILKIKQETEAAAYAVSLKPKEVVEKIKKISPKEMKRLEEAERRAEAKAAKKRQDDYLKAIGKFVSKEDEAKARKERIKMEAAAMKRK
jgi:hypothetical protein